MLSLTTRLTCASLTPIPSGSHAVLLMRHAERKDVTGFTPGPEILLTARGALEAERFGAALTLPVGYLHASPFPRSVDTASAIARGARVAHRVEIKEWLGVPGTLVTDWSLAEQAYRAWGPDGVLIRQLAGNAIPGFCPLEDGVATILRHLWAMTTLDAALSIAVTHDSVLAPVLATVTDWEPTSVESWPNYLDGLVLWWTRKTLCWAWRGQQGSASPHLVAVLSPPFR
jgi:broad specificity phosphatase PhoE